jgi:trimethylamine:corrinoid methyltransferase-like protein
MTDNYTFEHMTLTIQSINTEWWYEMMMDMIQYNDWVKNVRTVEHTDTNWVIEIIDDEYETHLISDLNLLEHLRTCWAKGDRTFVEPQNIDYDIIDCIVQELCFGELVYG